MERLAYTLVSPKKKSKFDFAVSEKFYYVGLGGLLLMIVLFKIFESSFDINLLDFKAIKYFLYGLLICVLTGTFYGFVDYNGNNRITDGIITFDEKEITLNHIKKFNLSEVSNLTFSVTDYTGRPINLITDGDPNKSYGGDNFVEFNYKNKKYKYQFIVNSTAHGKLLIEKTIPRMQNKAEIKY